MSANREERRVWRKVAADDLYVLYRHSAGNTEENLDKAQAG
jgi:hypothetical protein